MGTRIVSATELKAKWPALLTEMEQHGEPITITRRGRPVAELHPPKKKVWKSLKDSWAGRGRIIGDIVNTDDITDLWECVKQDKE